MLAATDTMAPYPGRTALQHAAKLNAKFPPRTVRALQLLAMLLSRIWSLARDVLVPMDTLDPYLGPAAWRRVHATQSLAPSQAQIWLLALDAHAPMVTMAPFRGMVQALMDRACRSPATLTIQICSLDRGVLATMDIQEP